MKKSKYTILVILLMLASYGAGQLWKNVDIIYQEGQRAMTEQATLNQPANLPQFALLTNNIDESEEREKFWAEVSK